MSAKILDDFQRRRQLQSALAALGDTHTEIELWTQARAIAESYPAPLILATMRRFLDTSSSQLRGGLGRLATLLPRDETVAMLQQEARNRSNPTAARLTAALILERFLGVQVPPGLMSDLQNPETVVLQSLEEALTEARSNRHILLEYVQQMRQEAEEVAHLVMSLLERFPPRQRIPLLRLIAYDARMGVVQAAIERLSRLRAPDVLARTMQALHSLAISLPPDRSNLAERTLRKLRFAGGATFQPGPAEGWRALLSPVDPQASQQLWFVYRAPEDVPSPAEVGDPPQTLLLGLHLNHLVGLVDAFGHEGLAPGQLPPARQPGEFMSIALADGSSSLFLETRPGYGQDLVRRTLQVHWDQEAWRPLPPDYTLYDEFLWSWQDATDMPARAVAVHAGTENGERDRANGNATEGDLAAAAARLLRHPAMVGWIPLAPSLREVVEQLGVDVDTPTLHRIQGQMQALLFPPEQETLLQRQLGTALTAQAEWLQVAGFPALARDARQVAQSIAQIPLAEHPLPALMVQMGMSILLNRLRTSSTS